MKWHAYIRRTEKENPARKTNHLPDRISSYNAYMNYCTTTVSRSVSELTLTLTL